MSKVFDAIGNAVSKTVFSIRKNSPEIEFWGGLGLTLVGTGIAIYQSVKRVPEIKQEARVSKKELALKQDMIVMSEEEVKKEERKIVVREFTNYVKAFSLPAALVGAGVFSEIKGFLGEKARYVEATAYAAATAASFASYRKRNAELIGEDKEKALYYGAEVKKVKEKIYDENGNVVGTETTYQLLQRDEAVKLDPYTYEFSPDTTDACREGDDMFEYNMAFLVGVEKDWNHIFKDFDTKVVWLADILRAVGLEEEARLCSRNVGWLNPKFFNTSGDGYIAFRITPLRYIASDGRERWKFMLNFNCDGNVYELVKLQVGPMAVIGNTIP